MRIYNHSENVYASRLKGPIVFYLILRQHGHRPLLICVCVCVCLVIYHSQHIGFGSTLITDTRIFFLNITNYYVNFQVGINVFRNIDSCIFITYK